MNVFMENFNEQTDRTLQMGMEEDENTAKGILGAIIGMLVGILPFMLLLVLLDLRFAILSGLVVGSAVSFGWAKGKGPQGAVRQVTVVILVILGAVLAVQLGYAIHLYREGFGRTFMHALELVNNLTVDSFHLIFSDFGAFLDYEGQLLRDILWTVGFGVVSAWPKWGTRPGQDLEVLDPSETGDDPNNLDNLDGPVSTPVERSPMDEVLNQEVPAEDIPMADVPTAEIPTLEMEDIEMNK